jgi:hypothetical protein
MDAPLVKVRIGGPAKLGGRWLKPGDEPEVTEEERVALQDAGVLLADDNAPVIPEGTTLAVANDGEPVDLEAKARELAAAMFDGELTRLEAEVKHIMAAAEAEVATANARATSAEAERDALKARIDALEGELKAAAATAPKDTPPSETVAKTAPKKGALTTTKG